MMNLMGPNSALSKNSKFQNQDMITQNHSYHVRGNKHLKDQKISLELQYMKFQQQYRRQVAAYQDQIDELKSQLNSQQQVSQQAQSQVLSMKQELNTLHRQNLKIYQQNEKNKKLVQSLKSDNQALQVEIQRWKSDRKTYSNKLDSIYDIKKNMNLQLLQKNTLIQQQQARIKQIQKKHSQYKLKCEQLSSNLIQKQRQNKQLSLQVKVQLQAYFDTQSMVTRLQFQLKELNESNIGNRQKINLLQKDKQILIQRIYQLGGDRSDRSVDNYFQEEQSFNQRRKNPNTRNKQQPSQDMEYIITPTDQRLMLEIQTFMREFEGLLDRKAEDKHQVNQHNDRLVNAVQCLAKNL